MHRKELLANSPTLVAPRRGRPRKFTGPSRAVTLTLPEAVLSALAEVDRDLSRAVVRLAQPELARRKHPAAELATFGGRAVIVVNPSRTLEERTGVLLVPLSDGRALIAFDESMTIARLELQIRDALDEQKLSEGDAQIFATIEGILKTARRSPGVTLTQRQIVVLESDRAARHRRRPPGSGRR
jgi:hypothetical protein